MGPLSLVPPLNDPFSTPLVLKKPRTNPKCFPQSEWTPKRGRVQGEVPRCDNLMLGGGALKEPGLHAHSAGL